MQTNVSFFFCWSTLLSVFTSTHKQYTFHIAAVLAGLITGNCVTRTQTEKTKTKAVHTAQLCLLVQLTNVIRKCWRNHSKFFGKVGVRDFSLAMHAACPRQYCLLLHLPETCLKTVS